MINIIICYQLINMCSRIITVDDVEYTRISDQCKKQNHIFVNDNLMEIIDNDRKTLDNFGITFNQLNVLFDAIKKNFKDAPSYKMESNEIDIMKKYHDHISTVGTSSLIFDKKFVVVNIEWMGAEKCPFQSLDDKKYYGHEYGSTDWFFLKKETGKSMHIGDLLFHQIIQHHFFQSPLSDYRVDPEKLINFFDLKPGVDFLTTFSSEINLSGHSKEVHAMMERQLRTMQFMSAMGGVKFS